MSEKQYDQQSKHNVERWVAAHIIPVSPKFEVCPHLRIQF